MSDEPKLTVTGIECGVCERSMHLNEATGWWVADDGSLQCMDKPWQPVHEPVRVAAVIADPKESQP